MRTPFTGCGTALVTPFTSSGEVDEAGVRRLAKRQIDAGVHFLVPCGTTGEAPTLSHAERMRVVELVVAEAAGRVPVLAGAGGYDTKAVVESARAMQSAGASGLLSVTPYYNKPTPEGLYRHYQAIAEATPLPIVGAVIITVVKNVVSTYIERWNILLGLIFVVVIMFMPSGLVPGCRQLWRWIGNRRKRRTPAAATSASEPAA